MALPQLFQTKEVLNKVLNAGEDALKVDIDNVTLDGSQLSVDIDKENDSIVIYSNTAKDGSGTNYAPLLDSDGHLQVDTVSSALPSGAEGAERASHACRSRGEEERSFRRYDTGEGRCGPRGVRSRETDDEDRSHRRYRFDRLFQGDRMRDLPRGGGARGGAPDRDPGERICHRLRDRGDL